jgi:hypothetical protein
MEQSTFKGFVMSLSVQLAQYTPSLPSVIATPQPSADKTAVDKNEEAFSALNKKTEAPKKPSSNEGVESQNEQAQSVDVQAVIKQLKQRDQEVRAHEMAHLSAAGGLAVGGMSFEYQKGPDGRSYAVGGEVQIDVSPGATPEETLQKAQRIQQAALAPAEPSAQDLAVANSAQQMAMQARAQLSKGAVNSTDDEQGDKLAGDKTQDENPIPSKESSQESSQEKGDIQAGLGLLQAERNQFLLRLAVR